jgi:hypothetical protein
LGYLRRVPDVQPLGADKTLRVQRKGTKINKSTDREIVETEKAEKLVSEWLDEVGRDEHGIEWDDIADLKKRIAKALAEV